MNKCILWTGLCLSFALSACGNGSEDSGGVSASAGSGGAVASTGPGGVSVSVGPGGAIASAGSGGGAVTVTCDCYDSETEGLGPDPVIGRGRDRQSAVNSAKSACAEVSFGSSSVRNCR